MFLQAYGAAVAIIVASTVLGRALCVACARPGGLRSSRDSPHAAAEGVSGRFAAAPMVGLAALIVLEGIVIKGPGRAVTAAVVGVAAVVAAAAYLIWQRSPLARWSDAAVALPPLLAVSIPFLASGRVGLQGVSLLNDTANHLLWAEGLRSARMAALWVPPGGYPLGPHSLVAAVGTLFGAPLDLVFTGLLLAVAPLTAMAAAGFLRGQALWRRVLIGLLTSCAYLAAAYYGEGAFKETIMGGLLVAFVVYVGSLPEGWRWASARDRWLSVLPGLVIIVGAVYTYSYLGVAWFGAALVLWAALALTFHHRSVARLVSRRNLARTAPWVGATILVGAILVAPVAGQAASFFGQFGVTAGSIGSIPAPLANLIGPLSGFEMLGIWTSSDFRDTPHNFHTTAGSVLALAVLVYGIVWSLRRRDLLAPATVVGAVLIWWYSRRTQSPYVAAKALVIAAPLIMAVGLRALLSTTPSLRLIRPQWASKLKWPLRLIALAITALFCVLAGYASLRSLRDSPVQTSAQGQALEAFHSRIGNSSVLFLGNDDFSPWELRQAAVTNVAGIMALGPAAVPRPNKPVATDGQASDFDSITPADLDHFRFVVTSNTSYASQPYANFRLVASDRMYQLWQRVGPTVPRQVIEPAGAPGAVLDCRSPAGRHLAASRGIASIFPTPPIAVAGGAMPANSTTSVLLRLPRGRWQLSIQYFSDFGIKIVGPGLATSMPAYLGRLGPFFAVGAVDGRGSNMPMVLTFSSDHPSLFTSSFDNLFTEVTTVAATRIPDSRQVVPLRQACGKYVDWYRLS